MIPFWDVVSFMRMINLYVLMIFLYNLHVQCHGTGLPCSSQHTMKPSYGKPQSIEENPPPYKLYVLNLDGKQFKYYKNEIYTVVLNTTGFFRAFLIQARLSTRQGYVIGHLRAGEFLQEEELWKEQGVQIQKCQPIFNDSITNLNNDKKKSISVKWTPRQNDGAIQFVLTVIEDHETFWVQWSPESGLILPNNDAKFTEQVSFPSKGDLPEHIKPEETKLIMSAGASNLSLSKESEISKENEDKNGFLEFISDTKSPFKQIIHTQYTVKAESTTVSQLETTVNDEVKLSPSEEEISTLEAEILIAKAEITTPKSDSLNSNEELSTHKEEVENSKEQISTPKEEKLSSKEKFTTKNEEIANSKERVSTTKEEISNSKEELSTPKEETFSSKEKLSTPKEDILSSNDELSTPMEEDFSSTSTPKDDILSEKEELSTPKEEVLSSKEKVLNSKEELSTPKEETFSSKEKLSTPKEDILSSNDELSTPKEEDFSSTSTPKDDILSEKEELSTPKEEVLSSKEKVLNSKEELTTPKEEPLKTTKHKMVSLTQYDTTTEAFLEITEPIKTENVEENLSTIFQEGTKLVTEKIEPLTKVELVTESLQKNVLSTPSGTEVPLSVSQTNQDILSTSTSTLDTNLIINLTTFHEENITEIEEKLKQSTTSLTSLFETERTTTGTPVISTKQSVIETEKPIQTTILFTETKLLTLLTSPVTLSTPTTNTVQPEHSVTTDKPKDDDFCVSFPCYNNGTCANIINEKRFQCTCSNDWTGNQCLDRNYCSSGPCKNNGRCTNIDSGYTCECQNDWAGDNCELPCPLLLCQHNGSCYLDKKFNDFKCSCKKGWTGSQCEIDVNECNPQPCLNGGTCIDKVAGFECKCTKGYMGTRCHRPCQDIYLSCESWRDEDKCEQLRPTTRFFDINCAKTCDQCIYDNDTVHTNVPLPPILEPFEFIMGTWTVNQTTSKRFPSDFQNAHEGYYEEVKFFVSNVSMFGTPYINYTTIAINSADSNDIQSNVGFMTLRPVPEPVKVAIMSTGNDGATVIEEGFLKEKQMNFTSEYFAIHPSVKIPKSISRKFSMSGDFLQESVERITSDGILDSFTKYYSRKVSFEA